MKNNLISVLTPTHNRKRFLAQMIESVARQNEQGFIHEHIIIDNKSTDGTRQMVRRMAKKDKRIKYIYNPKADWAYGNIVSIDRDNRLWKDLFEYNTRYILKRNFLYTLLFRNFIPGGSMTFARECIKRVGGWNPDIKTQDYEMSLKLAHAGYKPYKMDSYLYYYRIHRKQSHRSQIKTDIYKKERAYYLNLYKVTEEFLQSL